MSDIYTKITEFFGVLKTKKKLLMGLLSSLTFVKNNYQQLRSYNRFFDLFQVRVKRIRNNWSKENLRTFQKPITTAN